MLPRRTLLALTAALPGAALLPGALARPAAAQTAAHPAAHPWPDRPVRLVVPYPAGSTPDIVARTVAQHFSTVFAQPFVADNRAGAGGNLGTDAVAKATDGLTIGVSINGPLSTAPSLYPNLPYNPAKDLAPVSLLVRAGQVLVVHPSVPARTLAEFVAYAKANPNALTYGSVGPGSGGHLAMEDLKARAGIQAEHVPYRGFPQATLDLVAGRINAMIITVAGILPQVREGQAIALAVTAEGRLPQLPEVPTLEESGMPGATSYAWIGLIAPAATPADRVQALAREAQAALAAPQAKLAMATAGFEVVTNTPEEFASFIATETARWGGLIQRLGIRAE
ncbi:tripartite tricarboxylate transporter substrate binding protein [Roseomonas aerophila]|uniref:Tripartite tricarboxylate transporter substrate binding protein n=1 Tax=Teichococcus aerophilus TaxID=1224513 RepID=A0ABR7RRG7_9PROT|nr:tripartite tricarboxylate transporter substrate-binding protein [Pseudoroseomonas aerophila]MBC9209205.1 tripartite tricarboxylate transporter substrate binding protein [Pseudoroseomonas aerophila]